VRLTQGDYQRCTTYDAVPEEMVRRYADSGMTRIHVVDLDGAKAAAPQNLRTLERLARIDGVEIEWGGGLKDEHALRQAFDAGAPMPSSGVRRRVNRPCLPNGWSALAPTASYWAPMCAKGKCRSADGRKTSISPSTN